MQQPVGPLFKKLLLAAIVIYIIGSSMIQSDLYNRVGELEHQMFHLRGGNHPGEK